MFFVGVDLGQRRDFTAIAVVERCEAGRGSDYEQQRMVVRYLERMRLGTPYTDVVRRVVEMAAWVPGGGAAAGGGRDGGGGAGGGHAASGGIRLRYCGGDDYGRGAANGGAGGIVPKVDLLAGMQGRLERATCGLRDT